AYQLAGQSIVANQLVKNRPTESKPYKHAGYTFGSALRDRAMILETLDLMDRPQEAEKVLLGVAAGLDNNNWYSTQTTAYALLAIGKFGGGGAGKNNFSYTLNGQSNTVSANTYLYRIPIDFSGNTGTPLTVQNMGSNKLYVRVV